MREVPPGDDLEKFQSPDVLVQQGTAGGLDIDVLAEPCPGETSMGDFYKLFTFPTGEMNFLVGDATGHGETSSELCTALHQYLSGVDVSKLMTDPNPNLLDLLDQTIDFDPNMVMGSVYIRPQTREIFYASAGLPPLIILKRKEGKVISLSSAGPYIGTGTYHGITLPNKIVRKVLDSDDIVLILTDGILEARRKNRLLKTVLVNELEDKADKLRTPHDVVNFLRSLAEDIDDDITIIAFSLKQQGE